jgi:hypothetical protein
MGDMPRPGPQLAEQINLGPRSAAMGEVCLVFASLISPSGPISLSRFDPSLGFVGSHQKIVRLRRTLTAEGFRGSISAQKAESRD